MRKRLMGLEDPTTERLVTVGATSARGVPALVMKKLRAKTGARLRRE
jgi:hypothetical protein